MVRLLEHLREKKALDDDSSHTMHKQVSHLQASTKKPSMCNSLLFNCFRPRSPYVNPFLYDSDDDDEFILDFDTSHFPAPRKTNVCHRLWDCLRPRSVPLTIDDLDTLEFRQRLMANYSKTVLPDYPTAENNETANPQEQQHYVAVEPRVMDEEAPAEPVIIASNPNNHASRLENIVYSSQWQLFWALFLNDAIDASMHPTPLQDSFTALFTVLQPGQNEMMATLYLVQMLCLLTCETMNLKSAKDWLALIDPMFDWKEEVARSLQYKRRFLQDTKLPEDVQAMIWKDHLQPDVLHHAIRRCAKGVVAALDNELSQKVVTSHDE